MAVLDLGNAVAVAAFHPPAEYTASSNGASVDTVNFAYGVIVVNFGVLGGASDLLTLHVEHSETASGTYTGCKELNSTDDANIGPFRNTNAGDEMRLIRVDFNNTKRFIRLRAEHDTSAAIFYSASMVLMPYQTDATSTDTGSASAPAIEI